MVFRVNEVVRLWVGVVIVLTVAIVAVSVSADERPNPVPESFDVVSVKSSDPNNPGFSVRPNPNNFVVTGAPLKFLVQYAYDLHEFQIEGGPDWINSARFDVMGKMDPIPAESPKDREARDRLVEARLRSVLEDRFHLRVHKDTKVLPVYHLVVAKSGPKLQGANSNTGYTMAAGLLKCSYSSMPDLATMLSDSVNRIIIDQTNLTGTYAFTLRWTPEGTPATNDGSTPGLFTALQEQLGLKLESAKGPVPIVVIDNVVSPSKN
jgi:uncharacterized protein (TIGR03435 family)